MAGGFRQGPRMSFGHRHRAETPPHSRAAATTCAYDAKQLNAFSGAEGEFFDEWFDTVVHKQSCFQWTEERALKAAASALAGTAVKVYNSEIIGHDITSMSAFRAKMSPHFRNKVDPRTVAMEVLHLKRKSQEDVVSFCQRLTTMMACCPEPLSDNQKKDRLRNSLEHDINGAILVMALNQPTYAMAVDMLVQSSSIIGVKKAQDTQSRQENTDGQSSNRLRKNDRRQDRRNFKGQRRDDRSRPPKNSQPFDKKKGPRDGSAKPKYCSYHQTDTHNTVDCRMKEQKFCKHHNRYGAHTTEECRLKPTTPPARRVNQVKSAQKSTGPSHRQLIDTRATEDVNMASQSPNDDLK